MPAIGVFDSGVGGLTVLNALRARWPGEHFIYLADTARLPYGSKSLHTISQYVEQCIAFLRNYDLKAVVVACNSASTALLERPMKSDVPIFNVVEPGARKAVEVSSGKRIGVLGTRATVFSEAYVRAIHRLQADTEVFQQPCPLFVPLVEEGWLDDPVTNLIVYRYVSAVVRNNIDTLIMGCTHYPALRAAIAKAAGPEIQLVDSAHGLIEDLTRIQPLEAKGGGKTQILCTDFSPRLEETIRLLLGPTPIDSLETVDI
ncbi:MAG: glutamate racemase [Bdellovibrionales bacterium]|nr:glutamate racemase [Bdellovibrionales bacterium]